MKITNPIIPGFAPDPTIAVFKDTYLLINSSFHVFPGLPIYSSRDLVNWELKGHALSRPSQLSLSNAFTKFIPLPHGIPLIITGGLFAPTLRHFKDRFYLVCTYAFEKPDGSHEFQNFLLSCHEDAIFSDDGWSDAVPFEFPGIDPSLFFDEASGKAYLHGSYRTGPPWAPDCSIRQFEINVDTGEAMSECKFLWKGAAGKDDAEGPHIYFKDGWYYLLTAEASTFEGHQINIARSKDIWGPYESCPSNPLLTAFEKDEDVRWAGHGDLFQDVEGRWFCVHLGIRHDHTNVQRHPLGRETFLTAVEWPSGDWPRIAQTKLEMVIGSEGESGEAQGHGYKIMNEQLEDLYIRTPNVGHYSYSATEDTYSLCAQTSTLTDLLGTSTFVGRRQRSLSGSASTTVELGSGKVPELPLAGLSIYKDSLRHGCIQIDGPNSTITAFLNVIKDKKSETIQLGWTAIPSGAAAINLRIQTSPDSYEFLCYHQLNMPFSSPPLESRERTAYIMSRISRGICEAVMKAEIRPMPRSWKDAVPELGDFTYPEFFDRHRGKIIDEYLRYYCQFHNRTPKSSRDVQYPIRRGGRGPRLFDYKEQLEEFSLMCVRNRIPLRSWDDIMAQFRGAGHDPRDLGYHKYYILDCFLFHWSESVCKARVQLQIFMPNGTVSMHGTRGSVHVTAEMHSSRPSISKRYIERMGLNQQVGEVVFLDFRVVDTNYMGNTQRMAFEVLDAEEAMDMYVDGVSMTTNMDQWTIPRRNIGIGEMEIQELE
ncbi:Non-reducing end alpha-L-arabinofuranosidase BoGH43A [Colletotrichum sp. SAR 10_99]|nr:Non-reducing end alpha-L-arabinofuranosidase BoGH43A [Colletotrichum sp. SAR 10_96]KAJ5019098.1 Non-reducing end alpha-L-arabinofuranosidase BoGH43A [Colletotrichum sp. SAR 10_99]